MKKVLLINFFIFLIIISILEVGARSLNLANLLGVKKNLFILNQSTPTHHANVESIAYGKKIFTDQYGFRVPKINYSYEKKQTNILLLGDSVSFGVGVSEEDSFVGILRKKNTNFNFYNSSVIGHHLESYFQVLSNYNSIIDYENILIFICLNDIHFVDGVQNEEKLINNQKNKPFIYKLKTNKTLIKINFFLRDKSVLYVYFKSIFSKPSERYFNATYPKYQKKNLVDEYEKKIKKLKFFSDTHNKNISFVILPYEFQTRKKNCNEKNLLPQQTIKKILNKNDLLAIDLSQKFCNYKEPKSLYLKHDPVHLSKAGHKFVVSLIDEYDILNKR